MIGRALPLLAALGLAAAPVGAVGLGPLVKSGVIDGPDEAFFLTLMNPYEVPVDFKLYAIAEGDETIQRQVDLFPADATLASRSQRQVLVIAHGLAVDKVYNFRVCAERREPDKGVAIHARVCSKLSARRVA